MRLRAPLAATLAALIAVAPSLARPVLGAPVSPATAGLTSDAVAASPKVVIVVGATESTTPSYRSDADTIAAEALKYTPNVIKLYSPNATWAMVKAAAQGASIFVYLGHGYGFPSPYRPALSPSVQDGLGLNEFGGINDWDKKYYGESLIARDIRFAKNAVVLLNHLCYSAGSSESGNPEPTIEVARERVDNYVSGFIKAGARAVIAQSWTSGVIYAIRSIFTTNQTIGTLWSNAPNRQGHEQSFVPVRNPQYEGRLDPDTWTTGFHRSIVGAMDMLTTDVIAGAGAAPTGTAPTDTTGPQLWSVDGPRTLSPNFDGVADKLSLLGRYSETVNWTAELKNGNGDVVRSQTGTGHQPALTWDVKVNGDLAPEGNYTWNLRAADAAGNPAPDASGPFTVHYQPTPDTGVTTLKPTTPLVTTSGTVNYALTFQGPVTGLEVRDFTRTGSATKCVVGTPVGSGADYTIAVTGCTTGTVGFYLNQGTVTDGALNLGPAGPISAAKVTIDTTAPKVTTPRPSLRTGLSLEGSSTSQRLLMSLSWTGTDSGAGIASYDVARSYDGAAYATIASAITATSLNWTMTPGHSYRFRVRARDKAGNVGSWVAASTWYPTLTQQSSSSVAWTGDWSSSSVAEHSGGSANGSDAAGASATLTFSGRAIAWVTTLGPSCGEVQVWVDGVLVSTIDTYAVATTYRFIAFSRAWSSYASHTIQLVVVGTQDRPTGTLDAFELIR